ncbi:MAG: LuxR C-terminal-related transcriptional regulator [Phycisphaeraceae bacterium]
MVSHLEPDLPLAPDAINPRLTKSLLPPQSPNAAGAGPGHAPQAPPSQGMPGTPARPQPGDELPADRPWLDPCLSSPLFGAMAHAAEGTALLVGADVVIVRLYGGPAESTSAYVGTPGITVPSDQRRALQHWPATDPPLFAAIARHGPVDRPVLMRNLLTDGVGKVKAMLPAPLHALCRLADAFALSVTVEERCWAALLALRHPRRRPFVAVEREAVLARRGAIRNALWHGLHAHRPARPATRDLLARLSQTERQVLDRLRHNATERQVAQQLGRSPHTVHVHVKNIYRKLAVRSRRQLQNLLDADAENPATD